MQTTESRSRTTTKIMLIDDSPTLRLQLGRALSEAGFVVIEAVDGLDGLEQLETHRDLSLIVCDVNMPRMDGIQFLAAVAAREASSPPVIMLTTEGHPDLIQTARACGACGWVAKPVEPHLLIAAAMKLTGGSTRA